MNLKGFLDTALSQALELGIGSPDDVVRHVTPEILADHLPRRCGRAFSPRAWAHRASTRSS